MLYFQQRTTFKRHVTETKLQFLNIAKENYVGFGSNFIETIPYGFFIFIVVLQCLGSIIVSPSLQSTFSFIFVMTSSMQQFITFCNSNIFQDSLLRKVVIVFVTPLAGLKQFVNKFHWFLTSSTRTNRFTYRFLLITPTFQTPAMCTKPWFPGLKTSGTTISQFVLHRPGEMKRKMDKHLPQWTGQHTKGPLTGECLVKWTCRLGGLERAVAQCHCLRYVVLVMVILVVIKS